MSRARAAGSQMNGKSYDGRASVSGQFEAGTRGGEAMHGYVAALVLLFVGANAPRECGSPPSRASDSYWEYLEVCGCANVDPPSRASDDWQRFMTACSKWRERNSQLTVVVAEPHATATPVPAECASPPPRASDSYWDYIDTCGCAAVDGPPRGSQDYKRFQKACARWRESHPDAVILLQKTASPPAESEEK
jgi:hypothetical protein